MLWPTFVKLESICQEFEIFAFESFSEIIININNIKTFVKLTFFNCVNTLKLFNLAFINI
jgi:hypothetical protein